MSQDPDSSGNPDYYAARAAEERRLAMSASDPKVRAIHVELAERYARLAEAPAAPSVQVTGEQQKTG